MSYLSIREMERHQGKFPFVFFIFIDCCDCHRHIILRCSLTLRCYRMLDQVLFGCYRMFISVRSTGGLIYYTLTISIQLYFQISVMV